VLSGIAPRTEKLEIRYIVGARMCEWPDMIELRISDRINQASKIATTELAPAFITVEDRLPKPDGDVGWSRKYARPTHMGNLVRCECLDFRRNHLIEKKQSVPVSKQDIECTVDELSKRILQTIAKFVTIPVCVVP
jgi:hypothetical protein